LHRHYWEGIGFLTDLALDFQIHLYDKLKDFCYDDQTEILTRDRGFVFFKDLLQSDDVATRSKSGEFEWQRPTAYLNQPYSGPMYEFTSKGVNLKVTPKHRMLACQSRKDGWHETVMTAEEFAKGLHCSRKIPATSRWLGVEIAGMTFPRSFRTGKDVVMSGDDFCALLGAYVAEGSLLGGKKNNGIFVSQLPTSKGYVGYKELFDRLGGGGHKRGFTLHSRALAAYFKQFGNAHEKFIPEVIKNATPRQIAIFLHFYGLGDGCFRPKKSKSGRGYQPKMAPHYTTVSRCLADQLVELVQKAGYSSATYVRPPYQKAFHVENGGRVYSYFCDCRESYVVTTRHSKQFGTKAKKVDYSGMIHCVSVPNGIVYVRRNGKPSWCGNSEFEKLINILAVYWAKHSHFEDRTYDVVHYGMLHSGWSKLRWNSRLNGGLGDMELVGIAPWNIALASGTNDPADAEALCYYNVVTLNQLIRDYGDIARRVEPDSVYSQGGANLSSDSLRPSYVNKDVWAKLGDPLKKRMLGDAAPSSDDVYPKTLRKEFWLRDDSTNESSRTVIVGPEENGRPKYSWCYYCEPGEALYPRGRVITTASGVALCDSPNPYWHARFPFSPFRPLRVPWQLKGLSPVRPWLQMQNITNRIYGGLLDFINAILEPTLIAPKAAFPQADWDALDPGAAGGKIRFNNNSPKAPEFAKKAELPGWVFQYLQEIGKEYDMASGASAMSQALGKKQVPGDDALERIMSSRSLPIKVQSRALTSWVSAIGEMGVANILQFYSPAHRVAILGTQGLSSSDFRPIYGEALPLGMKPEEFVQKFCFTVKPDSTLASQKNEKTAVAFELQKRGILSARGLMRHLDANFDFEANKQELIEEARVKILLAGAAAVATGKGQGHGGHKQG